MAGRTPWSEIQKTISPERQARIDEKVGSMKVGMLINALRKKAGLTQGQLADKLGVTQQAVSKMEWGEEIQVSTLSNVINALGGELVLHMPDEDISLNEINFPAIAGSDFSAGNASVTE